MTSIFKLPASNYKKHMKTLLVVSNNLQKYIQPNQSPQKLSFTTNKYLLFSGHTPTLSKYMLLTHLESSMYPVLPQFINSQYHRLLHRPSSTNAIHYITIFQNVSGIVFNTIKTPSKSS